MNCFTATSCFNSCYKYLHHWQLGTYINSSSIIIVTIIGVKYFIANKQTLQITQPTVNVLSWKRPQAKLAIRCCMLPNQRSWFLWGSQSPTQRKWFSTFLATCPQKIQDYQQLTSSASYNLIKKLNLLLPTKGGRTFLLNTFIPLLNHLDIESKI